MVDSIKINGIPYVLEAGGELPWRYGQVLTTPFRLSGVPTPQDNQIVSRFPYLWNKGIGWDSQSRSTGRGVGGVRDADADTSGNIITLPHLQQSVALPAVVLRVGATVSPKAWATFRSELYLIYHDVSGTGSSGNLGVGVATFQNDDTYNAPATVLDSGATNLSNEAADLTAHKGRLFALYAYEASNPADYSFDIKYSAAGASWTDASGTGWDTALIRKNDGTAIPADNGFPFGLVLDAPRSARHDLIVALGEDATASGGAADQTRVLFSANGAGSPTWTSIDAAVPGKPRGKAMWIDPYTAGFPVYPVISTTEGLYLIDAATPLVTPILAEELGLGGDDNAGFMAKGADGSLYIANAFGDILRVRMAGLGIFDIKNIGPRTTVPGGGDGLVSTRVGVVSAMVSSTKFLYVAILAGTYSNIVRFHYETETWHSFFLASNANKIYRMTLSGRDDGTQRLHIMIDGGGTIGLYQFEKPDDPISKSGVAVEASGFVQFPADDLGDPHTTAGVVQAFMEADDLTATTAGEYIDYKTGTDGAAWGTDDRGDFLSGNTSLTFASGVGIAANILKNELTLNRDAGNTAQTPKVNSFEVRAVSSQEILRTPVFPIDLVKTAARYDRTVEMQIEELEAIFKTATQVTISAGKFADFHAKVIDPPVFNLRIEGEDNQQQQGWMFGTAGITFTQLIEGV